MPKRNLRIQLSFAIILIIAGCVSVPLQPHILSRASGLTTSVDLGVCDANTLLASNHRTHKPTQMLDGESISVLNWNIYKEQRENWESDLRKFSSQLDIMLIQEALMTSDLRDLLIEQNRHWSLNTAFYYDNIEAGVMNASKIESIASCGIRTTEPFIRIPKTVLISRYAIKGSNQDLLVANIHGINFTLGTEVYTKQINSLTKILEKHSGPIILAGDFNSWSEERLDIIKHAINSLSLQSLSYKNHNRVTVFGNAIDHVFYRGLEVIAQDTFKVTSSDHNPIKVTFKVPNSKIATSE